MNGTLFYICHKCSSLILFRFVCFFGNGTDFMKCTIQFNSTHLNSFLSLSFCYFSFLKHLTTSNGSPFFAIICIIMQMRMAYAFVGFMSVANAPHINAIQWILRVCHRIIKICACNNVSKNCSKNQCWNRINLCAFYGCTLHAHAQSMFDCWIKCFSGGIRM